MLYADDYTCNVTKPPYVEGAEFEMVFLNPDYTGNASDHFGDDLRGVSCKGQARRLICLGNPPKKLELQKF